MLPVFPVYPYSVCVSKSSHDGALPGPVYPCAANHSSTEVHLVAMLPGPWVKQTTKVFGDGNELTLAGHNTGMMIPHLSPIMDNLLLPLTMLTSSCAWPFQSFKVESEGKGLVGFFPAYAPFVFCDSPQEEDKPSAPKPPEMGARVIAAKGRMAKAAKAKLAKLPGREKLKALGDKTGFQMSISGRGRIYIPTCKTVMMRMNLAELLGGWGQFLVSKAFDALAKAALKPVRFDNNYLGRLSSDVARRRALETLGKDQARALSQAARREVMQYIALEIARKSLFDGLIGSIVLDFKVSMPYGLFSYSFADGKGKFLWWGELEGGAFPIEFRGLRGEAVQAIGEMYQPPVEELIADNPNHASAEPEDESEAAQ